MLGSFYATLPDLPFWPVSRKPKYAMKNMFWKSVSPTCVWLVFLSVYYETCLLAFISDYLRNLSNFILYQRLFIYSGNHIGAHLSSLL